MMTWVQIFGIHHLWPLSSLTATNPDLVAQELQDQLPSTFLQLAPTAVRTTNPNDMLLSKDWASSSRTESEDVWLPSPALIIRHKYGTRPEAREVFSEFCPFNKEYMIVQSIHSLDSPYSWCLRLGTTWLAEVWSFLWSKGWCFGSSILKWLNQYEPI